jgi:hypothetical protein
MNLYLIVAGRLKEESLASESNEFDLVIGPSIGAFLMVI